MPSLCITAALLSSYWLGATSGLENPEVAGIYGTACATMGMLVTVGFILAMDTFGPISDNAGGIAEMSHAGAVVRARTDRLDAVGNTTKALTKGYAVGSAGLATFLLFRAFLDEVQEYIHQPTPIDVNLAVPEVFVSGLLGVCLVFFFSSMALRAVGTAAQVVIEEVRRQFRERPGILQGITKPDYGACVAIVTKSALKEMVNPGLLVVLTPIIWGLMMRYLGSWTGRPALAIPCLASFLMCTTIAGIMLGLFFNNGGGAWDNAKKLVATGRGYPGKGSEAHKAVVTGDTVGDPCKDTAGPSLHVLVKLVSTIALVLFPLFVPSP
jgi:H(+)-translocating pyrophosphatase